jgi:small subunit ribosomal protein S1
MVNKPHQKAFRIYEGGPPPVDESWWAAVMAEDESQHTPARIRNNTPPPGEVENRPAQPVYQNDLPLVDWGYASELYTNDRTVTLNVTGYNRGGLLVQGNQIQGFVPISHLVDMPCSRSEAEAEERLAEYTGKSLRLKVIECDEERGRVVLSERAALTEPGSRNQVLHRLNPGDCIWGQVTNITDFGVFIDLGGVEGLVHVSEISWGRVRHPGDIVALGERVQVHVISIDREHLRVALSMKRLRPNPWETARDRYHPGDIAEAVVTSIVQFGAFARLEEGLDGLIHVSEMGFIGPPGDPHEMLFEGQNVRVRILHVDPGVQRLGLSLLLEE